MSSQSQNKKYSSNINFEVFTSISGDFRGLKQSIEIGLKRIDKQLESKILFAERNNRKSNISLLHKILLEKSDGIEKHSIRLRDLAYLLGRRMHLNRNSINQLCELAVLHDIGKIFIPESILMKPSGLTKNEWEIMKLHSEIGFKIAHKSDFICIAKYILAHHERWDGKGYPLGLKKEGIPLFSRIISVIDAYDVMITGRVYKEAITEKEAVEELLVNSGAQFDPEIVRCFIETIKT